ncbi:uncharacterized protein PHACADRAFT_253801 [Phanerochaete carnosa HHB-10118-sp]|uniref:Uncharacterized protein n=1 Tax=Phanerochaete carnosa (strain HHB-10118-sp) TaxID=650164 RepID=K5V238_PHACS|nr:uncharacterized protein PHACADRAFT_253801 [Phanerochaete carnosa HHB-10118-sp]EKM56586.1 hypothetical protein PHACADRAFT_253801 [Phanerochaete carnosa HHB-10118-sp]
MSGDERCPTRFDFGVRLGLVFIVETACLSAIASAALLVYIGYSAAKIRRNAARKWTVTTHVHWYFLSLLVSELIQAIGGIINVKWIADAEVTQGGVCTAQGVLKQSGDVGVALAVLAIALHTFFTLVFRWRPDPASKLPLLVVSAIWIAIALIIGISFATHRHKVYYGDTQYWCWITSEYPVQRIVLEYLWMWITAFVNIALYIPMALAILYDATVAVNGWHVRIVKNPKTYRDDRRLEMRIAIKMLVYPAVYTITVLPIAICRFLGFDSQGCSRVPWPATVFADLIFASSGFFNVLLYTVTRPNLRPHRKTPERSTLMLTPHSDPGTASSTLSKRGGS